ncbi:MAG: tRNA (guanosine(46)-N7)-methyltransferase TrmB [Ruminococcaceae bacterium]|nr:tRNA (guanosine(46)-N7)-methyltransferase TrmB [Oscillospiraceae bacterium]
MRRKKHGAERIAACSELLIEKGERVIDAFPDKDKPLCLEIGCGKGGFACGVAAAHPEINLVALERVADVACLALEKAKSRADERPDNLRFMIADARELTELFEEHTIDRIYLNFSDPWPKKGYAKRRLTHADFLKAYRKILVPGGALIQKTDNENLFDFSLEQFEAEGLRVEYLTRDLHHSEFADGNVMTEYEKNFSSQGMPIYSAKVIFE